MRNAAVLGDRGALCGPYVTTGCLEAAHRAGASDGTLPTWVMVTSGVMHDQTISAPRTEILLRETVGRLFQWVEAVMRFYLSQLTVDLNVVCIGIKDFGVCSTAGKLWTSTVCVFLCVPVGGWARCRLGEAAWGACSAVQGLRGLNPAEALSQTHCERGLFLKDTQWG